MTKGGVTAMEQQSPRKIRQRPRRISVFDGQDLKNAILAGAAWLEEHRETINALNVFPVPDGDTGSNMSATMKSAIRNIVSSNEHSASVIASRVAHDALLGARGNSGVILSQTLRGLAEGLANKQTFTAQDLAQAFQHASQLAYRAVIKPVEGTILTVIRATAEVAKTSAIQDNDFVAVMQDVVNGARHAVARTPELLPMLKEAGVVDAGGQGFYTILEGILRYMLLQYPLTDRRNEENLTSLPASPDTGHSNRTIPKRSGGFALGEATHQYPQQGVIPFSADASQKPAPQAFTKKGRVTIEEEFGYEVVFLLRGSGLDVEKIRQTIIDMGGVSTVVAGDEYMLRVHTHTLTPGKILDYGVSLGSLLDINIENLQEQSLAYAAESAAEHAADEADSILSIATMAVVSGLGFEKVFQGLGVNAIVSGGQTMNPSIEELLAAVEKLRSECVVILPNNSNVVLSAQQVAGLTQKRTCVVPSKTLPQGIAALVSFNSEADFETNCKTMTNAIKSVQTAEITTAVRSVQIGGLHVREDDYIGVINGHLAVAGQDMDHVVHDTLRRMHIDDAEIVTLYYGQDIAAERAKEMARQIQNRYSQLEIEVVDGGQPYYAYVLSVE